MLTPTSEQQAIITFAKGSTANGLVNALAGTGKTSTIEMICHAVQDRAILYLAFNRRIVDEAKKRMPSHVECRTQNSLGHGVWAQATGKRLVLASDKMRTIVKVIIGEMPRKEQGEAWEEYSDTIRWLQRAKRDGYVPRSWTAEVKNPVYHANLHRNTDAMDEWLAGCEDDPSASQRWLINEALTRSITAAFAGGIDYDDQIYMPVLFGGPWPKFPLVLIDEAQDWGPLGHRMLDHLVHERIIAVGDPWQSIYAFKGAVSNGMRVLQTRFNMESFPLSKTWRVPKVGVSRAQARVPSYRAADTNPEGEIHHLDEWSASSIPAGAAVLCRNNAPLISLGLRLLAGGRKIKLVGFDIGAGLVRTLKKLGPPQMLEAAAHEKIDAWLDRELLAGKKPETLYDRAECLHILCRGKETLGNAIIHAENLFKQEGVEIQLMSGHKSKGLEWDEVFHLDPWRIPSKYAKSTEALAQEHNLAYVIETRFKQTLYLVEMEKFSV